MHQHQSGLPVQLLHSTHWPLPSGDCRTVPRHVACRTPWFRISYPRIRGIRTLRERSAATYALLTNHCVAIALPLHFCIRLAALECVAEGFKISARVVSPRESAYFSFKREAKNFLPQVKFFRIDFLSKRKRKSRSGEMSGHGGATEGNLSFSRYLLFTKLSAYFRDSHVVYSVHHFASFILIFVILEKYLAFYISLILINKVFKETDACRQWLLLKTTYVARERKMSSASVCQLIFVAEYLTLQNRSKITSFFTFKANFDVNCYRVLKLN
ncbi:hypothetical protein PUN28_003479 [Cardiocondyla obscurior]|uniref:Uncharacterized protein n=1 Tax=Cardiocondyla obscurior TaxID=286306 RepID=A0AAW2GL96_9HYME